MWRTMRARLIHLRKILAEIHWKRLRSRATYVKITMLFIQEV